jgi:transcription initiation factor TFIIB
MPLKPEYDQGRGGMRSELVRKEVDKLAAELSIPDSVKDDSERISDNIVTKNLMGRRPVPVIAASSVYTACRESHTPITLKDLASATDSNPRDIGKCYRSIISRMNLPPPNVNGSRYVFRVAEAVKASREATEMSVQLVKGSIEKGLGGRNPMTLAAAAVYLACLTTGEDSRQSDVADAAGVSEVSVRECIKAMRRSGVV